MPDPSVTRILQFPGYGVYQHEFEEAARTVTCWVRPETAKPYSNGGRNLYLMARDEAAQGDAPFAGFQGCFCFHHSFGTFGRGTT
jgi:hypothetical protein